MRMWHVVFRLGGELVAEPMCLPFEKVLEYRPLRVRDDTGKWVIWNNTYPQGGADRNKRVF